MMCTCRLFGKNQDTQNMGHEIAFNIMSWKTVTVTNSLDQKKNLFSEFVTVTVFHDMILKAISCPIF
jgi:hypothetical protein